MAPRAKWRPVVVRTSSICIAGRQRRASQLKRVESHVARSGSTVVSVPAASQHSVRTRNRQNPEAERAANGQRLTAVACTYSDGCTVAQLSVSHKSLRRRGAANNYRFCEFCCDSVCLKLNFLKVRNVLGILLPGMTPCSHTTYELRCRNPYSDTYSDVCTAV